MAGFDETKPAGNDPLGASDELIRDNFIGLRDNQLVNAGYLQGYTPSNSAGQIPISNGTLCTSLNAELLNGQTSSYFTNASNINAGTLGTNYLPTVPATKGGTGQTAFAVGDILYCSATNVLSKLAKGANGTVLTMGATIPAWVALAATLPLTGGTMSGDINMGTHGVTNMADPVNPQDGATMHYVDDQITAVETLIKAQVPKLFSVNYGASSSGKASFTTRVNDTSMKVSATSKNLKLTHSDGTQEAITADKTISTGIIDFATNVIMKEKGNSTLFIVPVDGTNVCTTVNAIEHGHYSSYAAANAFDGVTTNYWESLEIASNQLGVSYLGQSGITSKIQKIRIYNHSTVAANMPSVKIQYANSATPTTWVDIMTVSLDTAINIWNEIELADYTPSGTHSIRILANANIAGGWVVHEIEMYTTINSILYGAGIPSSSLGVDGDYYTDICTLYQYKKASGAWAQATPFLPIAQGIKAGGTLGTPISYAFNGKYKSPLTTTPTTSTRTLFAHNIGTMEINPKCYLECITPEFGYAEGERIYNPLTEYATSLPYFGNVISVPDKNTISVNTASGAAFTVIRKDNGALAAITIANWKIVVEAERSF